MYDMTNLASLYDLEEWISDAHQKTAEDPAITYIMIGNKADVVDLDTSNNEGKMFGARHGVVEELQFRISAEKENSGSLHDILKTVAQKIYVAQVTEESVDKEPQIVLTMSSKNSPAENRKSQCTKC